MSNEEKYGPFSYNYISKIKSPNESGATTDGSVMSEKEWAGGGTSAVTTEVAES